MLGGSRRPPIYIKAIGGHSYNYPTKEREKGGRAAADPPTEGMPVAAAAGRARSVGLSLSIRRPLRLSLPTLGSSLLSAYRCVDRRPAPAGCRQP